MRRTFAIALSVVLAVNPLFAQDTAGPETIQAPPVAQVTSDAQSSAGGDIIVPGGMQMPVRTQESQFIQLTKNYKRQLEDLLYSARRHNWHFGPNEVETLKAVDHLLRLANGILHHGEGTPQGREALYQMKQPLTYVSQFLPYNPVFSHVVHGWDTSLQTYQKMVQAFTGTNVQPAPPIDFNSPVLKKLQMEAQELRDLVDQFSHQLKNGLPMVNAENHGLIAYVDHFKVLVQKLHSGSYSFVTNKHEMEQHLRESIKISKQITAIVLYHPNEYIRNSWTVIRGKANQFRTSYEQLMQQ